MAGTFYGSNQTINGTNGPDTFTATGNGSQDTFNGLDGSDSFDLGSEPSGSGQYTNSTVNGGLGNDTIGGIGSRDVIYGNQNDDRVLLNGTGTQSTIYGGQGNDVISGQNGSKAAGANYLIYGNRDNDFIDIFGAGGSSTLYGGQGNDTLIGSLGSDSLVGGNNDDVVVGAGPGSTLYGDAQGATAANSGDDIVLSVGGTSTAYGGYGDDLIGVSGAGNLVYGNQGNDAIIDGGNVFTSGSGTGGFSTLYGGQGSDVIATAAAFGFSGRTPNDVIYGNLGDDVIFTSDGSKTIGDAATVYGGQGDDQIIGNNAQDVFTGGIGSNTYFVGGATPFQPTNNLLPPDALTITDFVSGKDRISFSGDNAESFNFTSEKVTGGLNQATVAAAQSKSEYTFIAGDKDGYLFYNPNASTSDNGKNPKTTDGKSGSGNNGKVDGSLQVVELTGLNSTNDITTGDIFGGTAPTPSSSGFSQLKIAGGFVTP